MQDFFNFNEKDFILINLPLFWTKTPPLAGEYICEFLRKNGFRALHLDLNAILYNLFKKEYKKVWLVKDSKFEREFFDLVYKKDFFKEFLKKIRESKAKVIGISVFERSKDFAFKLFKEIYSEDKIYLIGGPQVLFEYYKDNLNYFKELFKGAIFVIGEGELAALKILKNEFEDLKESNKTKYFEYLEIQDLDKLPFIEFKDLDLSFYGPFIGILRTRGCTKRCVFCSECFLYKKYRTYSPEYFLNQVKILHQRYPKKFFSFQDSDFFSSFQNLEKFLDLLLKENIKIFWEAQVSINKEIPESLLKKVKKAGCQRLFIGLETGSDSVLERMQKRFTTKEAIEFFKKLKKAGIFFEVSLMTGFYKESEKEFKETLNFLKKNKKLIPKVAQISPFIPYAPSLIYRRGVRSSNLKIGLERAKIILKVLEETQIKYTQYFINNLVDAQIKNKFN